MAPEKKQREKPLSREQIEMSNQKLFEFLGTQKFNSVDEINEFLRDNVNGKRIDDILPKSKKEKSEKEKSDDLLYEAYECKGKKGLKLAEKALQLNPKNVRALIYFGDNADTLEEAIVFYKNAVEIGKKELGEDYFEKNTGHFWGLHETRPYMTAVVNYANCLRLFDRLDEAIEELEELLKLNPNDNQGNRYLLASLLLRSRKYDRLNKLFNEFNEEYSTFWFFNKALFLFATEGATERANKALVEADGLNRHVIKYLLFQKEIKRPKEEYYSMGDDNEAIFYIMDNLESWNACSGAIDWLKKINNTKNKF